MHLSQNWYAFGHHIAIVKQSVKVHGPLNLYLVFQRGGCLPSFSAGGKAGCTEEQSTFPRRHI